MPPITTLRFADNTRNTATQATTSNNIAIINGSSTDLWSANVDTTQAGTVAYYYSVDGGIPLFYKSFSVGIGVALAQISGAPIQGSPLHTWNLLVYFNNIPQSLNIQVNMVAAPIISGIVEVTIQKIISGTIEVTTASSPHVISGTVEVQTPSTGLRVISGTVEVSETYLAIASGVVKVTTGEGIGVATGMVEVTTGQASGSQPLLDCASLKPTSPIDITGWFSYYQCLLTNTFIGLGNDLTGIGDSIADGLTKGLTTIVQPLQASLTALTSGIGTWFTDPYDWLKNLLYGFFKSNSPSIAQEVLQQSSYLTKAHIDNQSNIDFNPIRDFFAILINNWYNVYWPQLRTVLSTSFDTAEQAQAAIDKIIQDFTATAISKELPFEFIPFINLSVFTEAIAEVRKILGIDQLSGMFTGSQATAGLGEFMRQEANADQKLGIPDQAALNHAVELGRLDESKWNALFPRASGMDIAYGTLMRELLRAPLSIQDVLLWNLRHPGQELSLKNLQSILGIDYDRYGAQFEERKFADISIRILKTLYAAQAISIGDVDFSIRRAGYRSTTLPGQSKSDFQAMHDYIVGFQESTVLAKALQAKEQLYVKGIASRQDLATIAAQVYLDSKELDSFMSSADDKRTLFLEPTKTIPLTLLEKMVKAKVADITFANSQIDLYRFPPDVTQVYKAYFLSLVGTSGT